MNVDWLTSAEGKAVIASAREFSDTLSAVTKLRKAHPELSGELISEAVTQAGLQRTLSSRWAGNYSDLILTSSGIEQATRPDVANWRAEWIKSRFGPDVRILDLTCGLGFDAMAMARSGLSVTAVELDPLVAHCAAYNLSPYGVEVICSDGLAVEKSDYDLLFIDPMRRDPNSARNVTGQQKRILDPESWSPSWSQICELALSTSVICKVAPGIQDQYLSQWDCVWISENGDLVEAMTISNGTGRRSAVLIEDDDFIVVPSSELPPVKEAGDYLIVPNGAITRGQALATVCDLVNGGLVNEYVGWIHSSDSDRVQKLVRQKPKLADVYEIIARVKADEKAIAQ
ncbi:MAG: hypothetical protein KGQ38_06975, partial [Actinomycetales bacterium]|nr:hypothetical protein [Actinomycetales bacterium]